MKERFEGLSAWREKQQEERNFLESKLKEARNHIEALTLQNQELSGKTGDEGKSVAGGSMVRVNFLNHLCLFGLYVLYNDLWYHFKAVSANQSAELDALRAQVARLQAEKNDLVAMNSELQLKADQDSQDGSFIEVIRVAVKSNTHIAHTVMLKKM